MHLSTSTVEKAPASSTVAWKIPWTEEPSSLQSMGSLRVGHDWVTSLSLFTFHFHALEKEMATHSSVLAWRIPGTGEPGGPPSMGSHRVGHDWSDLAAAAATSTVHSHIQNSLKRNSWKFSQTLSNSIHKSHTLKDKITRLFKIDVLRGSPWGISLQRFCPLDILKEGGEAKNFTSCLSTIHHDCF